MNKIDLQKRLKNWAVNVVLFTRKFPKEPDFKAIRNQVVRCAPSSAANYRAACRGKSKADFINKLKIVEEELGETLFWLEFIVALEASLRENVIPLFNEGTELLKIIVSTITTSKANQLKTLNKGKIETK